MDFGGIRSTRHVEIETNLNIYKDQDENFGWFQISSESNTISNKT